MDFQTCTSEQWIGNEEYLSKQLESDDIWDKIPLLNANKLQDLKDGSLVRFRGMIQDMHNPEYYLEKYEIVNEQTSEKFYKNGKYSDAATCNNNETINFDSDKNITGERNIYVVISVPGINEWVQLVQHQKYTLCTTIPETPSIKPIKRTFDETMDSENVGDNPQGPTTSSINGQKKISTPNVSSLESHSQIVSKDHILNLPLPDQNGKASHVKVYKNTDDLKLNDVCDFVGFLSIDPLIEAIYQEDDDINKMEMETHHPPSSLVPRIHCVSFKKLAHDNPLINTHIDNLDSNKFDFIRKELLLVLTQLLLGDELAAEYLIFHLISEIYIRKDCMPLGKFSLNLSNIPKFENLDYVLEVYKFIELLVPKSHYLPMTLENLNDLPFNPKKDNECDRLTSGVLQLSKNTHIILDETKMSAGKLTATGINNVQAIANAIKDQRVTYNYNYYNLEFDCDIPFLIFSEGKSIVNVDTHIILQPDPVCLETFEEIVQAAKHFLKAELLNDIRKYLTLARLIKYEVNESAEELLQNEIVNMRQRGGVSADELHGLLVLARLVSISSGKNTLDENCWKRACNLEQERRARISK